MHAHYRRVGLRLALLVAAGLVLHGCGGGGGGGEKSSPSRPNTAPRVNGLADATIDQDTTLSATFTVADDETDASRLTVRAVRSNETLIPADGMVFEGSGASRTLRVTPAPGQTGDSRIEVLVVDPEGSSSSQAFMLTVKAVIRQFRSLAMAIFARSRWDEPVSLDGFRLDIDLEPSAEYDAVLPSEAEANRPRER